MDTSDLTRAMHEATTELRPRTGFAAAVLRGGRRRKMRGRIVIATGAATVTAIAATGTYALWPDPVPGQNQAADPRLTQATRGDLSADKAFLNAAARAWKDGLPHSLNASRGIFDDLRGQPHVYWAGTTPAGPTAVIMQEAYLHPHDNISPDDTNQFQTLVGLVAKDPADGTLRLTFDQYQASNFPSAGYFQFGPGDRTVLLVDRGTPMFWSASPGNGPDGRITRAWQPVEIKDGVGILQSPDGCNPSDMRVLARATQPAPDDRNLDGLLTLQPASEYLTFAKTGKLAVVYPGGPDNRLYWMDAPAHDMRAGAPFAKVPTNLDSFFFEELTRAGMIDTGARSTTLGLWYIVAGLPDGRGAIVSEVQVNPSPSRIYTVLLKPDGSVDRVFGGDNTDPAATLPVKVHLPDGQGWIVADYGSTLRYRTAVDNTAGYSPALIPEGVTQVEVTKNGTTKTVDLK